MCLARCLLAVPSFFTGARRHHFRRLRDTSSYDMCSVFESQMQRVLAHTVDDTGLV
ncbi:hypothetical protein PF005_g27483 [Phytophthora fragariae]|uniref:Uncharacterized protein n=1 Tax=Phytophthora fragariae TaxID=53985 RepID=A0A6A3VZN4_9STRA|nr:hypothetical protein PF003_g37923 [Phytophthora fragariae]KAE8923129.1 hypothetical protein PF009_g26613 [Phytophthora fragariae]KAE9076677.1 hypothetical protein PF006_g28076 [Phytophthora fragariae]KAE9083422.1 hypothetical protein PF007_g21905 [Phytophthora fragariae]KAE9170656.1 hypothetical protein PF005_g27483 [Phytophthora fragariae]